MKRLLITGCAVIALTACSKPSPPAADTSASASSSSVPSIDKIPAGDYTTDPMHSSLVFSVSHMGYSHYTAKFNKFTGHLTLDPAHPEGASLTAEIDPTSLDLNAPPAGFHDELMGKGWFEAGQFPKATFKSTKVELTGANTAHVTGDFTLHGITKPVSLDVTFNGGYPGMAGLDPQARIGFSAHGVLKRSEFGMGFGVPAPGSNMGVGDAVDFQIETEMLGPPLKS